MRSRMLLIGLLVSPGPRLASVESDVLMDSGHAPPPPPPPPPDSSRPSGSSDYSDSGHLLMDLSQDTAVGELMPVLAQVVSGSTGGVADGMYTCLNSVSNCVHVRKPRLRLEEERVDATDQSNGEPHHTRRTITDGSTTLYSSSPNVREGGSTTGEDWVWLDMATDPPRHARLLNVFKVRDAGCPDLGDRTQRGQKGDIAPREAALETQLGDVYTHAGRPTEAATCYRRATTEGTLSREQRCRVNLALCTATAKQVKKVRSSGPLSREREEAACISSVLAKENDSCSADDAATAHITAGVVRLSQDWDTGGALDHFLAATAQHEDLSVKGDGGVDDGRMVQGDGFEWGAVWLVQAIRGQAREASVGFAANATVFGEVWAATHLRSWRRHLERKCSGIGMGSVIEGAERLILARTRGGGDSGSGENKRVDGSCCANSVAVVSLHLALARMLILHGAFEEAGDQVRAAEKMSTVEGKERSADVEVHSDSPSAVGGALHLELALFSRTPVVLESGDSAIDLRRELLVELERLEKNKDFMGSVPNPLEVGVRAQFLATYQGLNDKPIAVALARTFDQASGGTLSYFSYHLRSAKESSHENKFDKGKTRGHAEAEQTPSPGNKGTAPSADVSSADNGSQSGDIPDPDAHEGDARKVAKEPKADVSVNEKIIRVGFVSSHFRWHSVGRLAVGLLEQLSRSVGIDIFIIDVSADGDSAKGQSGHLNGSSSLPSDTFGGDRKGGAPIASYSITTRLSAAGASIVKVPLPVAEASPSSGEVETTAATSAEKRASHKRGTGNPSLQRVRETIAALVLDVLVFGDVGMDALTTSLAYGRLSPVQVAFWGHPATTGLPTVDYFITSDLFEGKEGGRTKRRRDPATVFSGSSNRSDLDGSSAGAMETARCSTINRQTASRGKHIGDPALCGADEWKDRQGAFSEQLVRLDGLGIVFDDPVQTFQYKVADDARATSLTSVEQESSNYPPATQRTSLETSAARQTGDSVHDNSRASGSSSPPERDYSTAFERENANRPRLYVCAQSLMKMHPSFDAVLAGILIADPFAHIVLLRGSRQLLWHSRFRRRLRTAVDDAERRATNARFVNGTAVPTVGSELLFPQAAPSSDDSRWKKSTPSSCSATPRPATSAGINELPPGGRPDIVAEVVSRVTTDSKISRKRAFREEEHYHHSQEQAPTAAMGDFWNRVRFVSPMSGRDFFRLQCRADVVLDPFPFGGGVTVLEALTCGTPVVTAGVLQSVHRLAEGMIVAAAGAATARNAADHEDREVTEAGAPVASTTEVGRPSIAATVTDSLEGGGEATGDGPAVKHHHSSEKSSPRARRSGFDGNEHGVGTTAGAAEEAEVDAVPSSNDTCALIDRLVAATTDEYVTKAVALATPGKLRECVSQALKRGRDGILRGDSGVARDWERFLRVAAASPTEKVDAYGFHWQASSG